MKRIKCPNSLVLLPLFLTLLWIGSSVPRDGASCISKAVIESPLPDSLLFENGDVILRRGQSWVSALIAKGFPHGNGTSHCGILVWEAAGWQVIHSISGRISDRDGIRKEAYKDFVKDAEAGKVYHAKPAFAIDRKELTARAKYYLQLECSFDHDFDMEDSSSLYCSEFVRAVYLDAGTKDVFLYCKFGDNTVVDMASFFSADWVTR